MVKTLSLIMALSAFIAPNTDANTVDKPVTLDENYSKIERSAPPLYSGENYTIIDQTEGGVPTRFRQKERNSENKRREKCPHKSKDIQDCDKTSKFNLSRLSGNGEKRVIVKVKEWEIVFTTSENSPPVENEEPTTYK